MNIFGRVFNLQVLASLLDGLRGQPTRTVSTDHVKRNARRWDSIGWKSFRSSSCQPTGGPKLTGSRLNRVTKQCSIHNLTVLCAGRKGSV